MKNNNILYNIYNFNIIHYYTVPFMLMHIINQIMVLLALLVAQLNFILVSGYSKCLNRPTIVPKYYLIEKCYRSKVSVVSYANYSSLKSCQRLSTERNGLALNFSPPEAWNSKMNYTCEILKCAEVENGYTLSNDTRYDYYSLYANPLREYL